MRNFVGMMGCIAALALLVGCNDRKVVAVHPVSGQILYGGKPAAGVHVYFYPTSAATIPEIPANPHGVTDANGKYSLTTFSENDGAAEGGYQVILFWPPEHAKNDGDSDSDRLLGWFNGVHSKLTANVKTGTNTLPAFKLNSINRPPEAVNGIPGRN
jgi:hypothetical protein